MDVISVEGSGNNYDVKFSYEEIAQQIKSLTVEKEILLSAHKAAQDAADYAISAVGGASNDIGKVVNNAIVSDTKSQLDAAIEIVTNLIEAMNKVNLTYSQQKSDILSAVNKAIEFIPKAGPNQNIDMIS